METERRNQPEADSHIAQYWGWYYLTRTILTLRPQSNCLLLKLSFCGSEYKRGNTVRTFSMRRKALWILTMNASLHELMDEHGRCDDGWMDGWMHGWMDGWMDG